MFLTHYSFSLILLILLQRLVGVVQPVRDPLLRFRMHTDVSVAKYVSQSGIDMTHHIPVGRSVDIVGRLNGVLTNAIFSAIQDHVPLVQPLSKGRKILFY